MADIKQIEFAIKGNDLATKPLSEIGDAIAKLTASLAEIVPASEKGEKNLSDLTEVVGQLKTALKGLAAGQNIINEFTALSEAIATTTAKLEGQRSEANAAKLALESTGLSAAKLKAAQNGVDTAIVRTEKALTGQTARLEKLKVTALSAGLDFNRLAESQLKVDSSFLAAASASAKADAALAAYTTNQRKAAVAARELAEAEKLAAENRRKAGQLLSVFTGKVPSGIEGVKRFKDAILEMTVAFVGFYGAVEQLKSAFEAIEKLEGTKGILTTTFGGEKEAAEQLQYVATQADRLGLKYLDLAGNYAKFTAAAVSQGVSVENARQVFETFAEAARVKNLSADSVTTIFSALEKIMAKDTVAAGDLFRKLTTELPDVAAEFRKTFGDGSLSTENFDKILKSGKITSDFLIGFAAHYRETFAEQLSGATRTTTAELARFGNAIDQLKIQVLEGGALDAFAEGLKKITGYLKSDDGKKFTEQMAHGLKIIADGFGLLIDHLGAVKTAVEGVAAVWILRSLFGLYADIKKLAEGFTLLAANVALLRTELNLASLAALRLGAQLKLAAGAIGAGLAGWEFGTWLYENIAGVRVAATALIGSFDILLATIKGKGKLAITSIFDHANYAKESAEFDKAQLKRIADFKEQMRSAGRDEDGAALPASGAAGDGGAGKPHTEYAADAAARTKAEILVQMGLIDDAAKGVANHLSGLRAELAKKNATELQAFIIGLDMQLKPVRDEIAKLSKDYGKNADATVSRLRAGLDAYRSDAIAAQQDVFAEHAVKDSKQQIEDAIRLRDILIHNEEIKHTNTGQTAALTQSNLAAISAKANVEIGEKIIALQAVIAKLKPAVQTKLTETSAQLVGMTASLGNKQEINPVKELTDKAEEYNHLIAERAARMDQAKQLESAGIYNAQQTLDKQKQIAAEYVPILQGAKAYVEFLRTSANLTDDERKALEKVANTLDLNITRAKQTKEQLYGTKEAAADLAAGFAKVGEAFAKHLGQAHGLKGAFQAAGAAFKQFASDFLLKIAEMIVQAQLLKLLQIPLGGSTPGTGSQGIAGMIGMAVQAGVSHMGGMAGAGVSRQIHAAYFNNAPRYHAGGLAGVGPNEVPAILQRGEEVLARNDARNAMNGGKTSTPQHIQVVNAIDHESVVRQGLQAPSNTKVVLNMIRANRQSIKASLA